jgi:Fur family transcriptional regulator, iron response regulator
MKDEFEHERGRLKEAGIAATLQRLRIAALVLSGPQHVTAEQVLARLVARGERVSKATVYNTLNLFASRGVLRQLCVDPERAWFDSNTEPHFHVLRVDTGELTDLPVERLCLGALPALPSGTEVDGVEVLIRVRPTRE